MHGPNQYNVCSTVTLAANTPVFGTGLWTIVSGTGGVITNPTSPTSTFTGMANTTYILSWTISNACSSSSSEVYISVNSVPATAYAGPDQLNVCAEYVTLAANTPSNGIGIWSIVSGTGGEITNTENPASTFIGSPGVLYDLRWTITTSCGSTYSDVEISFNSNISISNAGPNQYNVCAPATLAGNNPGNGTGLWTIVNGTDGSIINPTSPTSTFYGVPGYSYTLSWTVTTSCGTSSSEVFISIAAPPTEANAGQNQINVCSPVTLAGNTPLNGTGTWSIISGVGGEIYNVNNPTSTFTGIAGTTYVLAWAINTNCPSNNSSEVTIQLSGSATTAYAGPNQLNVNGTTTVISGNTPSSGTGMWSIVSGTGGSIGNVYSATTTFSGLTGYSYILSWTITSSCGSSSSDVTISFGPTTACGTSMTDSRDGQTYSTVLIGNQCWMSQNLNYGTWIYSFYDQSNNGVVEKYCYNDEESNCSALGGLYTWYEAMNYNSTSSSQGICPSGWHMPSDQEMQTLEIAVGMSSSLANTTGWRGNGIGTALTIGGSSGFNAIYSGAWGGDSYEFSNLGSFGYWWTSTQTDSSDAINRTISINQSTIDRCFTAHTDNAEPIRCLKN